MNTNSEICLTVRDMRRREQPLVVKPPIIMRPPITQTQLAEAVARFTSATAMWRDFEDRSDPDTGGSVEAGELRLDAPVIGVDIDILEDTFRDVFISRSF